MGLYTDTDLYKSIDGSVYALFATVVGARFTFSPQRGPVGFLQTIERLSMATTSLE